MNVRDRLTKNNLTSVWLINQLAKRGISVDKSEFSSILSGTRKGAKADLVIKTSNEIIDHYEEVF